MKKCYYFQSKNVPLNVHSVIYHVFIGQSERDRKYHNTLREMAFEQGFTLIPWDESVDFYLTLEQERVFHQPALYGYDFNSVKMNIADLMRIIRTVGLSFYEQTIFNKKTFVKYAILKNPFNYFKRKKSLKSKKCPNGIRKNLSLECAKL